MRWSEGRPENPPVSPDAVDPAAGDIEGDGAEAAVGRIVEKRQHNVRDQTKQSGALPPNPRDLSLWGLPDVSQKKAVCDARPIRIVIRTGARVASQRRPILRTDTKSLSHHMAMTRVTLCICSTVLWKRM
jgi:hypothetical protein